MSRLKWVAVVLSLILGPVMRWLFHPGPRLPAPIRYRVALTGGGASEHDIVVAGDQARVEPVGTAVANVIFRCDTETFVLMMLGRLTLPDARAQHRLGAEGETEWVDAFAQWFRGV